LGLLPLRILDPQPSKYPLLIFLIKLLTDSPNKFYNVPLFDGLVRALPLNHAIHVNSIEILSSREIFFHFVQNIGELNLSLDEALHRVIDLIGDLN
jgi:hypothetical protein